MAGPLLGGFLGTTEQQTAYDARQDHAQTAEMLQEIARAGNDPDAILGIQARLKGPPTKGAADLLAGAMKWAQGAKAYKTSGGLMAPVTTPGSPAVPDTTMAIPRAEDWTARLGPEAGSEVPAAQQGMPSAAPRATATITPGTPAVAPTSRPPQGAEMAGRLADWIATQPGLAPLAKAMLPYAVQTSKDEQAQRGAETRAGIAETGANARAAMQESRLDAASKRQETALDAATQRQEKALSQQRDIENQREQAKINLEELKAKFAKGKAHILPPGPGFPMGGWVDLETMKLTPFEDVGQTQGGAGVPKGPEELHGRIAVLEAAVASPKTLPDAKAKAQAELSVLRRQSQIGVETEQAKGAASDERITNRMLTVAEEKRRQTPVIESGKTIYDATSGQFVQSGTLGDLEDAQKREPQRFTGMTRQAAESFTRLDVMKNELEEYRQGARALLSSGPTSGLTNWFKTGKVGEMNPMLTSQQQALAQRLDQLASDIPVTFNRIVNLGQTRQAQVQLDMLRRPLTRGSLEGVESALDVMLRRVEDVTGALLNRPVRRPGSERVAPEATTGGPTTTVTQPAPNVTIKRKPVP